MKRSEALIPLSHDHHHALFVSKLLRDAAEGKDDTAKAVDAFEDYWVKEGILHFRVEEEVLLPNSGLEGPSADEDVAKMLDGHLEIRRLGGRVLGGDTSPEALMDLGTSLFDHVRFEERDLFPRIEGSLGEAELENLARLIADAEKAGESGD